MKRWIVFVLLLVLGFGCGTTAGRHGSKDGEEGPGLGDDAPGFIPPSSDAATGDDPGGPVDQADVAPTPDAAPPPVGEDGSVAPLPIPQTDTDGDGVLDVNDNCPLIQNPGQEDVDDDKHGNICDLDADGDGVFNETDCEPLDGEVFQGNPERCNGIDDDCDGGTDVPGALGCQTWYLDNDGDGSGISDTIQCVCQAPGNGWVPVGGDCNDADPGLNPWVVETCNDQDDNCNLLIDDGCDDDGDGFCDAKLQIVGTPAICPKGGGDCFDYSAQVSPLGIEVPANGIDDDCDGKKTGEPTTAIEADCTGMPCTGTSMDAILCGLDLCYPGMNLVNGVSVQSPSFSPTDGQYAVVNHFGDGANDLKPFGGDSYVLLASGPAEGPYHSADIGGNSISDPFAKDGYPTYNNMEIVLNLKAPPGAKGFTIDYIYFSEEYEEYIGSSFNDKFYIILNAPQTTGGQDTVINYTACSAVAGGYSDGVDANGQPFCYIAINTAFSEPCANVTTNINGTGFECPVGGFGGGSSNGSSTGWLQTSWPIAPEESFTLKFHIHDTSDGIFDSEVVLDHFHWEAEGFTKGTASHN